MTTKRKSEALTHVREVFGDEIANYLARGVANGYLPDEEDVLMDFARDYEAPVMVALPSEKTSNHKPRKR